MPTIIINIDTIETKMERAIALGETPFKEIAGTDQEKEYERILQNIGFRVLMTYRNTKKAGSCP
jgi:hypothetical protein